MIKTVIFDIGNVLMKFDWFHYLTELFHDPEIEWAINDAIWGQHAWDELDRGVIPLEEVLEGFVKGAPQYEKEIRLAFDQVDACMYKLDYAIPWIQEVKAKDVRVLYLSNYSEHLIQKKPEVLDFIPYMDGGVFSCRVHLIKPDPAIYQAICDTYGLVPEETIFVDDNRENIASALKFGLRAIRFESYEQAHKAVNDLLNQNA